MVNSKYGIATRYVYRVFDFLRCRYESERILKTIDLSSFRKYQETYRDASPDPGYSKYLDIKTWIKKGVYQYYSLGVHRSKAINILDIGTGCGYFPYICNYYGHKSVGIDIDEVPMYREITRFLNIDRRIWRVRAYERLHDFGMKFNLVTAFLVCFNNHDTGNVWGKDEWKFFLNDLAINQLYKNGKVFLLLNAEKDGQYYDDQLCNFFLKKGAMVNEGSVYFKSGIM